MSTTELDAALTALPPRIRVHELAKRANLTSKQLLAVLAERGISATSAASSLDRDDAIAVLSTLLGPAAEAAGTGPAAEPAPAADSTPAHPADATPGDTAEGRPLFLQPEPTPRRRTRATKPTAGKAAGKPADSSEANAADGSAAEPAGETAEEPAAQGTGKPAPGTDSGGADAGGTEPGGAESDADGADKESAAHRRRRRGRRGRGHGAAEDGGTAGDGTEAAETAQTATTDGEHGTQKQPDRDENDSTGGTNADDNAADSTDDADDNAAEPQGDEATGSGRRRRRRRRKGGGNGEDAASDDPDATVVHVREARPAEVQGVRGSTRLEAKRQRRRESRDSRRRPQILSEAEFLARRESVNRVMAVRQRGALTQVALLEDGVLVEHFVSKAGSESLIGNVYLGRVQNVLPSMEAAFVDIGRNRNAVLYAGEVNWDLAGLEGKARRIETALSSGDAMLVQVSKDPIGHKGARLTTQISLPGRFLVFVPGGGATGISRKLPDTERKRLKAILDRIVPDGAGVIIRTAAEGVPEEELIRDVERLKAQWDEISQRANDTSAAPKPLSAEPDTLIKVIRDLFNSDINELIIDGDEAWESVSEYIGSVAPELAGRVRRYDGTGDVFAAHRVDEQITKALQRKVHLPSGGSLVIDRTEAMTVIDVNTGKFTGSGGNLEETVTKNNVEAAEEIVRQLRLRDIGGIIVVDFIDMVLESNRDLVLRRLTECLGRDRTRHQVAEVTSLGLIQMTRKRLGTGLVEAFSDPCPQCQGRGIILHDTPTEQTTDTTDERPRQGRRRRRGDETAEHFITPEPAAKITIPGPPDPRGPKPRGAANGENKPDEVPTSAGVSAGSETPAGPDADSSGVADAEPAAPRTRRRRAAGRPAGAPAGSTAVVDIVIETATATPGGDGEPVLAAGVAAAMDGVPDAAPISGTGRPRRTRRAKAPADGAAPGGGAPDGAAPGGAAPDGAPDGAPGGGAPGGAAPDGAAPDGAPGGGAPDVVAAAAGAGLATAPAGSQTTRAPRRRAASRPSGPPEHQAD